MKHERSHPALFAPWQSPAENPLDEWQSDDAFIVEALKHAESADIVSFDIFDTALTRLLNSPIDVFAEVERRLLHAYGYHAKGFAAAREQAEHNARQHQAQNHGAEEITFAQIYAELPALLPEFTAYSLAAEVECFVESQVLLAVPDILALTQQLNAIGKPWILVSDMYLPGKLLAEFLQNAGYQNWQGLHVSAEIGYCKASGNIWQALALELGDKKILHIGDDLHADIAIPQSKGIATLAYRRVISDRRVGSRLNPQLLPFSCYKRHLDLQDAAQNRREKTPESFWYRLGQIMGGMTLAHFVQWLAERTQLHQIKQLHFCARDGYLMQRAWETSGLAKKSGVRAHYLYISRAALNIISGMQKSRPEWLDPDLVAFLASTDGKKTVGEALERAGLSAIPELQDAAQQLFGSLDTLLTWGNTTPQFEALLRQHSRIIFAQLQQQHEEHLQAALAYFQQAGLDNKKCSAMVDMGWYASMQYSLNNLLRKENDETVLTGFYYGLWPLAKGNRFAAGLMESCFASDFAPKDSQWELWQAVALLEQLHSANEGTTRHYALREDGIAYPVCADHSKEQQQYDNIIRPFQEGALDTVHKLFHENTLPITLADLGKAETLAMIGAYMLSPTDEELKEFMTLGHCATFDHNSSEPMITSKMPESFAEAKETLAYSGYIIGQMRYWWINADAQQRDFLREIIDRYLNNFPARVLRQFS